MELPVTGAYGRSASLADWQSGKDMKVWPNGPYCSNRDVERMRAMGYDTVLVVDSRGVTVAVVKL